MRTEWGNPFRDDMYQLSSNVIGKNSANIAFSAFIFLYDETFRPQNFDLDLKTLQTTIQEVS